MIATATVPAKPRDRTYAGVRDVKLSDKQREERIRRMMAGARVRVTASCEEQASALGLSSHVSIVHRRQGRSPEADLGLEIDRLERAQINTDPIIAELLVIQAAARASALTDDELTTRLSARIDEEHALQGQEDRATTRAASTGCVRTLAAGMAPETDAQLEILGLARAAEERGLEVRL